MQLQPLKAVAARSGLAECQWAASAQVSMHTYNNIHTQK
jgi:hypothetical protein